MKVLVNDYGVEFPSYNIGYQGYETRYVYCSYYMPSVPASQEGKDNM